jgi:hypothetical protein
MARIMRWILPPAAVLLAPAAAGLMPAWAGTASSWQITEVLGGPSTMLQGMATSGPDNAVTAGTTVSSLVVQHWDGSAWQARTPPAGFVSLTSGSVNVSATGTSAAGNTWVFAQKGRTPSPSMR